MKVIIVDDEVLVRLGIKTYLEGYEDITVKGTFASAGEALAYMEREEVDIVLTDIEMGKMSGLEYIKALKACNYHCGIVILSCHENFAYVRESMNLGADKYMLKQEVCEDILVNELREIYINLLTKVKYFSASF
jgi:two-component system response regulator YesN